jgi:hypothetical protein
VTYCSWMHCSLFCLFPQKSTEFTEIPLSLFDFMRRRDSTRDHKPCRKRNRKSPEIAGKCDLFDALPDDLVISILCKLSSSAGCPSDFINVLITYVTLRLLRSSCLIFIRRQVIGETRFSRFGKSGAKV